MRHCILLKNFYLGRISSPYYSFLIQLYVILTSIKIEKTKNVEYKFWRRQAKNREEEAEVKEVGKGRQCAYHFSP